MKTKTKTHITKHRTNYHGVKLLTIVGSLAAVSASPLAWGGATLTDDASVTIGSAPQQTQNFGKSSTLRITAGSLKSVRLGFLKFNLESTKPSDAQVTKATLKVFIKSVVANSSGTLEVHDVNLIPNTNDFSESSITGISAPNYSSEVRAKVENINSKFKNKFVEFDVTPFVAANIDKSEIAFALVGQGGLNIKLESKESNASGHAAILDIVYAAPGAGSIPGPQGPQGAAGTAGTPGVAGPQGPQGASGSGTGPQGPQGADGTAGPQGPQGAPGSGTGPQGTAGPQGPQGAPGSGTGPQGPQGADGTVGPQGASGTAGPQGATGAAGAAGPQGATGAAGTIGPQGATGAAGTAGPQGATGSAGEAGPQGATGAAGLVGSQGPAGIPGAAGPQGAPGTPGAAGPQGVPGAPGVAGPQGTPGIPGIAGPQGAAGTPGMAGPQGAIGPIGPAATVVRAKTDDAAGLLTVVGDLLGGLLGGLLGTNSATTPTVSVSCLAGETVVGGGTFVTGALLNLVIPQTAGPTKDGAIITASGVVPNGWGAQFNVLQGVVASLTGEYGVTVVCAHQ